MTNRILAAMALALVAVACGGGKDPVSGCTYTMGVDEYAFHRCLEAYEYNKEACQDSATLVATTAGSPNGATCPNRHHRMRVVPATLAGEEIGATVFCECERGKK